MIHWIVSVEHMFSDAEKQIKEPSCLAEFHHPFPFLYSGNPGQDDRFRNDSLLNLEQIFKRRENEKD